MANLILSEIVVFQQLIPPFVPMTAFCNLHLHSTSNQISEGLISLQNILMEMLEGLHCGFTILNFWPSYYQVFECYRKFFANS